MEGAIFDLDGTLLDSMPIWDTLAEDYLRKLGREPKEDLTEIFKTFSLEQSAEYYRKHYGVTLSASQIIEDIQEMIKDFYQNSVLLKNGCKEFLENLQQRGVKMCIATSCERTLTEMALNRLGVRAYFSEIFTCTEHGCNKESPKLYRIALDHLGTEKEKTFVFEDAFHALQTAKNDGFPTVAVYDKSEKEWEKMKAAATLYCLDFSSLKGVVIK